MAERKGQGLRAIRVSTTRSDGRKVKQSEASDRCKGLQKAGFYIHESSGSHIQMKHSSRPGRVTVPYHERFDLPKHIVKSIIRQAGLTNEEFFQLLER